MHILGSRLYDPTKRGPDWKIPCTNARTKRKRSRKVWKGPGGTGDDLEKKVESLEASVRKLDEHVGELAEEFRKGEDQ